MRTLKLADSGFHECDNCARRWYHTQLQDVANFEERVCPGEPSPSGECPLCGALCHPVGCAVQLPDSGRWLCDDIQFPRLIAELNAMGAFSKSVLQTLSEETDLDPTELVELIDRAVNVWDSIKSNT